MTGADTSPDLTQVVDGDTIAAELKWLSHTIEQRLTHYFNPTMVTPDEAVENHLESDESAGGELSTPSFELPAGPALSPSSCGLAQLITGLKLSLSERLVLALAIAPYVQPQLLDIFFTRNKSLDRGFTEFGGVIGKFHSGFLPTMETVMFVLHGDDTAQRLLSLRTLTHESVLFTEGLLVARLADPNEPPMCALVQLSDTASDWLTGFDTSVISRDVPFPANKLNTELEYDDLVLEMSIRQELKTIEVWADRGQQIERDLGLGKYLMPGYRCLFWGPPGTGKTLAATVLGKSLGLDVYRVDLSNTVSKWIGETEKNLARLFEEGERRRWILFFDEADALFGKRTTTQSSNDRHANQEIAYLLQRMETYPGLVVMASNLKANIDEAFGRRIQAFIHFPMPSGNQRVRLWQQMTASMDVDDAALSHVAQEYEIAGGTIANAVRDIALVSAAREDTRVTHKDLQRAIARELSKEGRSI